MVEFLTDYLLDSSRGWWLQLAGGFLLFFTGYFALKLKDEAGRQNTRRLLDPERVRTKSLDSHYRRLLRAFLDGVDARLPAATPEETPGWRTAWSGQLLDKALLFAVLYPIFSLIFVWWIAGQTGFLGTLPVLEAEPNGWLRTGLFALVASPLVARAFTGNFYIVFGVTVFAFAVAFAGAVAGAFAVAFAVAGAGAGAGGFAVAFAFAGGFAVATQFVFASLASRRATPALAFAFLFVVTIAALSVGAAFSEDGDRRRELLIFYGVLPLTNALFDFVSIGITRWTLRQSVESDGFFARLKWSAIDACGALLSLFGLILTLLVMVRVLNAIADGQIVDLSAIFEAVREDGHSYWWLYLTLFSTLLPTIFHFGLCIYSFAVSRLSTLDRILAGILDAHKEEGDASRLYILGMALPIIFAFSFSAPFIVTGFAGFWIVENHQEWGYWVLDQFEAFAVFVGTILPPAETMEI